MTVEVELKFDLYCMYHCIVVHFKAIDWQCLHWSTVYL